MRGLELFVVVRLWSDVGDRGDATWAGGGLDGRVAGSGFRELKDERARDGDRLSAVDERVS